MVPPTEPCALRSTQPLKVSTRDFSWGEGGRCVWLTTNHPCSAETSRKSEALTHSEPLGPPRTVAGDLYFFYIYPIYNHNWRNINSTYKYNETSIKRNILTIKQNTSGSRSGCGIISTSVYRVSHELRSLLRESVPYVKIYRYNPKHLRPKLNGYGDNGHRKVWASGVSTYCTPSVTPYSSTAHARQRDVLMQ